MNYLRWKTNYDYITDDQICYCRNCQARHISQLAQAMLSAGNWIGPTIVIYRDIKTKRKLGFNGNHRIRALKYLKKVFNLTINVPDPIFCDVKT